MRTFTAADREQIKQGVRVKLKQTPIHGLDPAILEAPLGHLLDRVIAGLADTHRVWRAEAQDIRRAEGKCPGRSPGFGFAYSGKRGTRRKVINPEQRRVLDVILAWREQGFTLEGISAALAANKIKSPRGKRWSHSQIARAAERAAAFRQYEREQLDKLAKLGPPKSTPRQRKRKQQNQSPTTSTTAT